MRTENRFCAKIAIVLLVSLLFPIWVCAQENTTRIEEKFVDTRALETLKEIQNEEEEMIFNIPGIVGIGIGLMEDGKRLGFVIYCEKMTPWVQEQVPRRLNNVPVRLIESGMFRAY